MIIPDKKKATTIILSRLKDGMTKDMPVAPEASMDEVDPLEIAAQDLLQAMNDKSVLGVKTALQSFWDLIQSQDREQDMEA